MIRITTKLKEFLPICLLFSVLSLSFSLLLSQVYSTYKSNEQVNVVASYNFISANLKSGAGGDQGSDRLLSILTQKEAPLYFIHIMTINETERKLPPIVLANFSSERAEFELAHGRFFNQEEIENGSPIALVSQTFYETNHRREYVMVGKKGYQIVGVIADYRLSNLLTSAVYLNPSAYLSDSQDKAFSDIMIAQNNHQTYQAFTAELSQEGYQVKPIASSSASGSSINIIGEFVVSFGPIFFIAIISLIVVFTNYFKQITTDIGIKKMVGWTNSTLIFRSIAPLVGVALTSVGIGMLGHGAVAEISHSLPKVYLFPTILTFCCVMVVSLVMVLLMSIKISMTSPLSLMKGGVS